MERTNRVLLITDVPKTAAFVRFSLSLLGIQHDAVPSLADALRKLEDSAYGAAMIDLRWEPRGAPSLLSWIAAHLVPRGIHVVLTAETPLARNLDCAVRLPAAVFLGRTFDLLDLKEALGAAAMEHAAVAG